MILSMRRRQQAIWIGALLAALLVIVGCAEIQPYKAPNHREEGPQKGLFTGSQGEWVLLGPKTLQTAEEEAKNATQESETRREEKKHSENPVKPQQ